MNDSLFGEVNRFAVATPWLHPLVLGYATYGVVAFAALLLAGWWSARRSGDPRAVGLAVAAGVATLLAVAVNQPIVAAVGEPRPYTALPGILVLAHRSTDASFPSDHAVMAGAAATGLLFVSLRLGIAAWAAAVAMGFSRVYIAAHYPVDVVAGLAVGAAVAVLVSVLAVRPLARAVTTLGETRLRPVLLAPKRSLSG
jgi:undecaprenyl-diphosphatase